MWNYFAEEESTSRKYNTSNGYNANFSLNYDVPFVRGLSLKGTYSITYANTHSEEAGAYYALARAGNTNKEGMHLLGDHTEWGYINYGDPEGDNLDKKPRVKYGKKSTKSEQMSFAINYARVFRQARCCCYGGCGTC